MNELCETFSGNILNPGQTGCVYHQKEGGICGPWIPDDGKIVTHTVSKAGKMTQKFWTSKVSWPEQNFPR